MDDLARQVQTRRSQTITRLFSIYCEWLIARNFHGLRLCGGSGLDFPASEPVVVYSNHSAWWDPLVFLILAKRLFPARAGFGPMDARALKKYAFMKKLGIFGVDLDAVSGAKAFLRIGKGLLGTPGTMLWITAQGHFADVRSQPMTLRPGIAHLSRNFDIRFIPLAIEYTYWEERYPEILLRMGAPFQVERSRPGSSAEVLKLQEQRLQTAMQELADRSIARDASAFRTLIDGSKGVGGVYDWVNQFRYFFTGRTYRAGHREFLDDGNS